ncbi:MAG: tRNA uridine-5-carboxymethylaminomethyl(34) synthesis GTPase MnmE [Deltaproteobacteria bacterium HGW-Deltaproteobacteria-15]|jgi:tRNA modification GTPase|nr:MAG: tRNA uridine-5-carboxymethylaminomethyl(34) synthesis GTPase MnmE [Deltaproteobacteria bacterium HGW-Deltaproteobacteria-15]
MDDTIAAIATPLGQGGIGIIRLSGPRAKEIAGRIFIPKKPGKTLEDRSLVLGNLIDPSTGAVLDEVLLSLMAAPLSYTREDVVEINSHSGPLLLSKVLQVVLQTGARLARPGEFTFRAFMNGRIDLTQAEAVVDLIRSRSEKGLSLAARQLSGGFAEQIEGLRQRGLDLLARIEAAIDFPEEADSIVGVEESRSLEENLLPAIERLVTAHKQRKIWMDGIATVIVGRVNAGKSSLLNRLLNEERALVTPIPGTTRDVVESTIHIEGIPLRLMDTAGFRKGRGRIEHLGIRKTEQRLSEADLALVVIDQSRPLSGVDRELLARTGEKSLTILNKSDLPSRIGRNAEAKMRKERRVVKTSALTGSGLEDLRRAIVEMVVLDGEGEDLLHVAPNIRQRDELLEAEESFRNAARNLKEELPLEIVAADLHAGVDGLGRIVGKGSPEDVLDRIFSEFCIGK